MTKPREQPKKLPQAQGWNALPWWEKPIYYDRSDEPQFIGDVLFQLFILVFVPYFFTVALVTGVGGANYLLTYDGIKVVGIAGTIFMLAWWWIIWKK